MSHSLFYVHELRYSLLSGKNLMERLLFSYRTIYDGHKSINLLQNGTIDYGSANDHFAKKYEQLTTNDDSSKAINKHQRSEPQKLSGTFKIEKVSFGNRNIRFPCHLRVSSKVYINCLMAGNFQAGVAILWI